MHALHAKGLFCRIGNFVPYTTKKHGDAQLAEVKLMLAHSARARAYAQAHTFLRSHTFMYKLYSGVDENDPGQNISSVR